jgi:hypothetical protein
MIENSKGAATAKEVTGEVAGAEIPEQAAAEEPQEAALAAEAKAEIAGEEVKIEQAIEPTIEPATESVPTVREIFGLPAKGVADPSDDRWKEVQERLNEEVKGIKWTAAMPDLAPKLCALLDIKIPDVLLAAWKKAGEIKAAIEKSKQSPEETTYLELAEHGINSEHKPSIDVKLRGAKVKTITLMVHLGFKVKGFVLKIQNGAIVELQTGNCEAKGSIKYQGLAIAEKKLAPIKLPLTIPLNIPAMVAALTPEPEADEDTAEPDLERIEL